METLTPFIFIVVVVIISLAFFSIRGGIAYKQRMSLHESLYQRNRVLVITRYPTIIKFTVGAIETGALGCYEFGPKYYYSEGITGLWFDSEGNGLGLVRFNGSKGDIIRVQANSKGVLLHRFSYIRVDGVVKEIITVEDPL